MDWNLHYLQNTQLELIQRICCFRPIPRKSQVFYFDYIRENVNIIIECNDLPRYTETVEREVEGIQEIFKNEKDRRERERERLERNPVLLNEEWYTIGEDQEYEFHNDDFIEEFPEELSTYVFADLESYKQYDELISRYTREITAEGMRSADETIGLESYSTPNNFKLKVLALRLFRIKSKLLHAKKDSSFATGSVPLGQCVRYDDTHKKIDIYLFVENIARNAYSINCPFDDLFAITFIHEMFHALYSVHAKTDVIFQCNVPEVEEAMAEMGTIWYSHLFDNYYNTNLGSLAESTVLVKWNSGNIDLACYGLGYHLYKSYSNNGCPAFISRYQIIQRTIRYGNNRLSRYINSLSVWNHKDCIDQLERLFDSLSIIKTDASKHLHFDNNSYGELSKTVAMVITNYSNCRRGRIPRSVTYDFNKRHNVFIDQNSWTQLQPREKDYYDDSNPITLRGGTVVFPWRRWEKGEDSDINVFIDMVNLAYNRGWFNHEVDII